MKAYVIENIKKLEPFGDHPRDSLIANRRLCEIQGEVLQGLGMEVRPTPDAAQVDDPDEHIILSVSLFFTRELLQQFVVESRRLTRSTVCALKPGLVTRHTMVPIQDVQVHSDRIEYGLRYMPGRELRGEVAPVVIDPEQFSQALPFPEHMRGPQQYRIPITDTFLIQVDHWANLWAANMAYLLANVARLMKAPNTKLLGLALKARSLNKWKIFQQTNRIGKNCDIHPTAYIEGSTIGDNVMIGAGSIIRLSVIGDGTSTGSNVTIESSIVGEECSIDSGCGAFGSVLYPRTSSSNRLIFTSLCGSDTFIADGSGLTDFRIDGKNVTVIKDGISMDTGILGLGACLGHGVYLAPACMVAPGTAIPNGLRILPDKTLIIDEVNPDGTIPGHRLVTDPITGHNFSRSRKGSRTTAGNSIRKS